MPNPTREAVRVEVDTASIDGDLYIPDRASGLVIVPEATHLFEEPGALEEVASLATEWCQRHVEPRSI